MGWDELWTLVAGKAGVETDRVRLLADDDAELGAVFAAICHLGGRRVGVDHDGRALHMVVVIVVVGAQWKGSTTKAPDH